jgi:lipopolysaccharide export system protein LptC
MNDSVTRRWPALLTLAAMLLLAGASFWILQVMQQSGDQDKKRFARHEPDYVIENFRYFRAAKDGKISVKVEGETLTHFADTEESIVQQPRLTSYSPQREPLTMRSESAHINRDHSEIRLHDNVILNRPQTRGDEALTVNSDYMLVLTDKDIVKTDRPVRARLGESTLNGIGMVADNAQHTLALNGRVHANYVQPHRAKP